MVRDTLPDSDSRYSSSIPVTFLRCNHGVPDPVGSKYSSDARSTFASGNGRLTGFDRIITLQSFLHTVTDYGELSCRGKNYSSTLPALLTKNFDFVMSTSSQKTVSYARNSKVDLGSKTKNEENLPHWENSLDGRRCSLSPRLSSLIPSCQKISASNAHER